MLDFSDYTIFVDESGDHGLATIDPDYPIFVLACCIFEKSEYSHTIAPALNQFKFRWWGHDTIVLHENDIRRQRPPFAFLKSESRRAQFLSELGDIVRRSDFKLVASVIDKRGLRDRYATPDNPYSLAMTFCVERIHRFLREKNAVSARTHLVVEKRGKVEDAALELAFRRICDNNQFNQFDIVFVDKASNSPGLQFADLIARPIGLRILRPEQENQAFRIIESKFRTGPHGEVMGYGLKIFP
ncbi:MAG: DUF3800 domain-containing protein [Rhodospirillaceae bacterium]|nr:DUF3800 domain-containing protein [Rhodospirillaceae bacterium]